MWDNDPKSPREQNIYKAGAASEKKGEGTGPAGQQSQNPNRPVKQGPSSGLFGEDEGNAPRVDAKDAPYTAMEEDSLALFPAGEAPLRQSSENKAGAKGVSAQKRLASSAKNSAGTGGPNKGTPTRSKSGPPGKGARKKSSKNQIRLNIVIGSLIVILITSIVLAAVLPGCLQETAMDVSVASGDLYAETDYDPDAHTLQEDQFVGTVLPETEDAGAEYVEDTLFLGDSNTVRMIAYRDVTNVTMDNGIGIEGMGIQGVPSLKCVQFKGYSSAVTMPEAVKVMQPRRVLINFGTNNAGNSNVDSFISSYKKALDAIHESYPYSDIIIGSVFPVDRYHINESISMTTIDKFNVALAELAEQEGYKFLNWSEALRDQDKSSKNYGFCINEYTLSDGVHLTKAGMEAIFGYLRTHSYITKDTRPKPLQAIPQRLGTPPGLISSDASKTSGVSTTSTSASAKTTVVTFAATKGGKIQMNGATQSSFAIEIAPGGTCPAAVAIPDAGYVFAGWSCSAGSISDVMNPALPGFYVYPNVDTAKGVSVTATFKLAASSITSIAPVSSTTSVAPPPSSSATSVAPPVPSTTSSEPTPSTTEGAPAGGASFAP